MTSEDPKVIRLSVTEGDEESRQAAIADLVETATPEELAGLVVNLSIQNIETKAANDANVEAIRQALMIATRAPEGDNDLEKTIDGVNANAKAIQLLMDYVSHTFVGAPRCTQDECEECDDNEAEMAKALTTVLDGLHERLGLTAEEETSSHA